MTKKKSHFLIIFCADAGVVVVVITVAVAAVVVDDNVFVVRIFIITIRSRVGHPLIVTVFWFEIETVQSLCHWTPAEPEPYKITLGHIHSELFLST